MVTDLHELQLPTGSCVCQIPGVCVLILSTVLVTAMGGHPVHSQVIRPVRLPMGATITLRQVATACGMRKSHSYKSCCSAAANFVKNSQICVPVHHTLLL
jgi:hypothetical protein